MAKTAISSIITRIKRKADYVITDSDLDNLIVDEINDALKLLQQLFMDNSMNDEIGAQDSFSTTASQNYIAISTETVDFDQPIVLYEKTNDKTIDIISYDEFVALYPDSAASGSSTPDHAAFFANKLFLGPTPNSVITIYLDYIKLITEVTSASTMPFENKYDPLVVALGVKGLAEFLEPANVNRIAGAIKNVEFWEKKLITGAAKNIGTRRPMSSRKPEIPYFAPRKAE